MLEVSDLVAGYEGRAIARVANFAVPAGGAALLVGRSGAGKTTLLLAVAGLAQRLAGRVALSGQDLSSLNMRERDRHRGRFIGLVFQDLHLVPGLSAIDNMLVGPFAAGVRADVVRATSLLEELGLKDRLDARAETLSRGEAQRVAIARAALLRPRLILADEPTASLDDDGAAAVIDLLLSLTRETGAALLVATHDARVKAAIPTVVQAEAA